MAPRPLPSLERLNSLFYLCNTSPSGLRYKKSRAGNRKGDIAGTPNGNGYWRITIDYKFYYVHRIIFYMESKENPCNFDVHHVENKNNLQPLLKATRSENCAAKLKQKKKCSSVYKGVSYARTKRGSKKWHASITVNYKTLFLGYYKTEKEAAIAYNEACLKYRDAKFCVLNNVKG